MRLGYGSIRTEPRRGHGELKALAAIVHRHDGRGLAGQGQRVADRRDLTDGGGQGRRRPHSSPCSRRGECRRRAFGTRPVPSCRHPCAVYRTTLAGWLAAPWPPRSEAACCRRLRRALQRNVPPDAGFASVVLDERHREETLGEPPALRPREDGRSDRRGDRPSVDGVWAAARRRRRRSQVRIGEGMRTSFASKRRAREGA